MKKYNCKNCGAVLYWNPTSNSLECEYCGKQFQPSDFEEEEIINEKTTENIESQPEQADEGMQATDESDSGDLVIYKCSQCGAEVVTARSTIATTCAFCGEALSISDKLVDNFKPDYVVPFKITKEEAIKLLKKHFKKGVLTPKDFIRNNEIEKIKGMYAPFWLHSFKNNAKAIVSACKTSSSRRGYDKIETRSLYEVDIDATADFKNIPTDALKNISNKLMGAIEPFDYSALNDFSPAYMSGFYAEEYNEDKTKTLPRAEERADETMKEQILSSVKGYATTAIQDYDNTIDNTVSKYTMLPVWLFHIKYNNEDFLYAVNGQTGKVAGKLPKSKKLMIKYGFLSFAAMQTIGLIVRLITAIF